MQLGLYSAFRAWGLWDCEANVTLPACDLLVSKWESKLFLSREKRI